MWKISLTNKSALDASLIVLLSLWWLYLVRTTRKWCHFVVVLMPIETWCSAHAETSYHILCIRITSSKLWWGFYGTLNHRWTRFKTSEPSLLPMVIFSMRRRIRRRFSTVTPFLPFKYFSKRGPATSLPRLKVLTTLGLHKILLERTNNTKPFWPRKPLHLQDGVPHVEMVKPCSFFYISSSRNALAWQRNMNMQARSSNSLYFTGVALVDSHGHCFAPLRCANWVEQRRPNQKGVRSRKWVDLSAIYTLSWAYPFFRSLVRGLFGSPVFAHIDSNIQELVRVILFWTNWDLFLSLCFQFCQGPLWGDKKCNFLDIPI